MANEINLIVGSEAIKGLDSLIEKLNLAHNSILQVSQDSLNLSKNVSGVKSPSGLNDFVTKNKQVTDSLTKLGETQRNLDVQLQKAINTENQLIKAKNESVKTSKQLEQQSIKESNARNSLNKQREIALKAIEKENQENIKAENTYNKVQVKVNQMTIAYNDLATKKALGVNLSAKEEASLRLMTERLNKYQTALKSVDATIGKHQRNVGNYASANGNLSNSMGQIARELPNFGQSFQVGVLSLTNNIGALQDAIRQTTEQNKILKAEGQATKSVLSQIATNLFSMNVLLFVAIGLFSAYSKEIGEWADGLFGANETLKLLTESQDKFNKSRVEGQKQAVNDIIVLQKNIEIVKDKTLSDVKRKIALDELRAQYPFYFKNLTDEQIRLGQVKEAYDAIVLAQNQRQEANEKFAQIDINRQKRIELEAELAGIGKLIKAENKRHESSLFGETSAGAARNQENLNKINSRKATILEQINGLTTQNNINYKEGIRLQGLSKELDYKEEKTTQTKIKHIKDLNFENADYYASKFALERRELELAAKTAEELYKEESQGFSQRITSYQQFVDLKLQIADLDLAEQRRLNEKGLADAKASAKKEYDDFVGNKDATSSQRAKALDKYNRYVETETRKAKYDLELIEINHTNTVLGIQEDSFKKQQDLRDKQYRLEETKKINEQELNDYRQYQLQLLNVTKNITLKGLEAIENEKTDNVKKAQIARLNLEIQANSDEMSHEAENTEAWIKLNEIRIQKTKERVTLETELAQKSAAEVKKYLEDTKAYFQSFAQSWDTIGLKSLDFFTKLDKDGKTAFENLVLNGDNAAKSIGVAMISIGEVFQDVMNKVDEAQETRYQNEIKRLDNQKEISIAFAGESSTAKAEVERQYDEKRKRLDQERAQQKKKLALYNAIIDTAQAVIAGFIDSGYVGAIFAAALGAAQIALISSQDIPAYFEGGTHDGGKMLVNDAKGSNYKETIVLPNGNILKPQGRNVLMDAPKGTEIYTPEQWHDMELNKMLERNGISQSLSITNTGINKADFNAGIEKLYNKESFSMTRDVKGERIFKHKQGQKIELVNNRLNIKSFDV